MKAITTLRQHRGTVLLRIAIISACAAATNAQAASQALLMGSGEYVHNDILPNLPGIDMDLQSMREVALELGYSAENVRTLSGKDLNAHNVRQAFEKLRAGLGPGDHALVYFSGHGYQIKDYNNDESDGFDEILPLYAYSGDNKEYLLDDDFQRMLGRLPSARTHVFIDACCSGSSGRNVSLGEGKDGEALFAKSVGCPSGSSDKSGAKPMGSDEFTDSFEIKGAVFVGPSGESASQQSLESTTPAQDNVMYLGAAQDGESAVASSRGSFFTRAITHAVDAHGRDISPLELRDHTRAYLVANLPKYRVHTPNLLGDETQQQQTGYYVVPGSVGLTQNEAPEGQPAEPEPAKPELAKPEPAKPEPAKPEPTEAGPSQGEQLQQAQPGYGKIDVLSEQHGAKVALGGDISVDFFLEQPGYINLLVIDAGGDTNVLFPNAFVPESRRFDAGLHHLPEGFGIKTAKPLGQTDVWVVYSPEPMNLYQSSMRGKSVEKDGPFPVLSEEATRSLIRSKASTDQVQSKIKIGAVRFYVCGEAGQCE